MSDNDDKEKGVDSEKGFIKKAKRSYDVIAKYRRDRTEQGRTLAYSQTQQKSREQKQLRNAVVSRKATRRQAQNARRRKRYVENPRPMDASIKKSDAWSDLTDIWFRETFDAGYGNTKEFHFKVDGELSINRVPAPIPQTLRLAGHLHGVLSKYDMQFGNTYKPSTLDYNKFSDYKFCNMNWKSAINDHYMLEMAHRGEGNANIFTTENVLSAIMCCNRSKYSFDVVITKIGNKIFLDERAKVLSFETVDETSQWRPTSKPVLNTINGDKSLTTEATYINHVFGEQMLYHSSLQFVHKLKWNHPFEEIKRPKKGKPYRSVTGGQKGQRVASQAFSYNLYDVSDSMRVLCRCGIDGYMPQQKAKKQDTSEYVRVFALNQYNSHISKTSNWNKNLSARQANILAHEITNNNFKCARWGMKALLCGAKYMKVGFVTRTNVHSIEGHQIHGVSTFETKDWIRNKLHIRSNSEPWTVFAKFMKSIQELKQDGRYIAVRDPLKQVIRMYQVDDNAFAGDNMPPLRKIKKLVRKKGTKAVDDEDEDDAE